VLAGLVDGLEAVVGLVDLQPDALEQVFGHDLADRLVFHQQHALAPGHLGQPGLGAGWRRPPARCPARRISRAGR
jgi:hypothetical protein